MEQPEEAPQEDQSSYMEDKTRGEDGEQAGEATEQPAAPEGGDSQENVPPAQEPAPQEEPDEESKAG